MTVKVSTGLQGLVPGQAPKLHRETLSQGEKKKGGGGRRRKEEKGRKKKEE